MLGLIGNASSFVIFLLIVKDAKPPRPRGNVFPLTANPRRLPDLDFVD
jgi:hypothetical protein